MKAHLQYLSYVARHKWFVFLACWQIRAPLWNAIIHDWSKFTPQEWFPYVDYFYRRGGKDKHTADGKSYTAGCDDAFDAAWLRHLHRNPHHYQFWVLRQDDGQIKTLPMPERYVREMIADWIGAGRAQGHGDDVEGWYAANNHKMVLHPETRERVEQLLDQRRSAGGPWRLSAARKLMRGKKHGS
jgi:hypothetical protein